MRALVQRVNEASVTVDGEVVGSCKKGYLIFLGVGTRDDEEAAERLWKKILNLRIFSDRKGLTNWSLADINGEVLIVSQFTLFANCRRGNRPSFTDAAPAKKGEALYDYFVSLAKRDVSRVSCGVFGADMQVSLVNDGPFTIWLDL